MSEATESLGQTAPETPASPPAEAATKDETVNLESLAETPETTETVPPEEAPPADDFEEIDFEGEKYSVPKKLKDGFLRQSDYTRKTQELAEQRKALETSQAAVNQQAEAALTHVREVGQVMMLSEQLAQLDQINWSQLNTDDPFKAQELFQQRAMIKEHRDRLVGEIQQREQMRSQSARDDIAKRAAEAHAVLMKEIPGWNDKAKVVADYGLSNGVDRDVMSFIATNPALAKLLHKAYAFDQIEAGRKAAAKGADPPVQPKPLTKVNGSGVRPTKPMTEMSTEEYRAMRIKQGFVPKH